MKHPTLPDIIHPRLARTLPELFLERVRRSAMAPAYLMHDHQGWRQVSWLETADLASRWQQGLALEGILPGERVAIMLPNSLTWVAFDQAAMASGLVLVPLYLNDRAENIAHILADSGACLLVLPDGKVLEQMAPVRNRLPALRRILVLAGEGVTEDATVSRVDRWLPPWQGRPLCVEGIHPDTLATIIYTSGTTGAPKGVMLSHRNLLADAHASLLRVAATPMDLFLSFLPLSHALERTAGYYLAMMAGSTTAFARSILALKEDLITLSPSILISVPRIYERVYQEILGRLEEAPVWKKRLFQWTVQVGWRRFLLKQGKAEWHPSLLLWPLLDRLVARMIREKLGGRLRVAVSGGARLPYKVARLFLSLDVPLLQGYGMTETSPVLSVNTLEKNDPESVGMLLPDTEARVDENGELLVRGPQVMMGYWHNPQATAQVMNEEGWLRTGDLARLQEGVLTITGRLKEIIVMANGRKVSPSDLETAITQDPLFPQAVLVGENQPFLAMLAVLNPVRWAKMARERGLDPENPASLKDARLEQEMLERVSAMLSTFPGFAQIRRLHVQLEPWTVENGLITPTLKPKRRQILERFAREVEEMYAGHGV
ncbi:MAG: long-chain fatty acid--CoA ligase [Magnetococcales bacterium]|nr:long-chain fatty acid--CoA ligase [Magnetococcales bacterium]NGZ28633.1 long-chain fatty acid--CoA ligase [Magnetococcales bacterium]